MTPENPGKERMDPPDAASRAKVLVLARLALAKKARDLAVLNVGPLTTIAEYFVICSGRSVRQTRSIAQEIQTGAKTHGMLPLGVEGEEEGTWILMDYDDVVVHVFHEPTREFFDLESLWADAPVWNDPQLEQEKAAVEYAPGQEDPEDDEWAP